MKNKHDLTQGTVSRVLLRFSIPFVLANLLQALYGAVDLMVIGAYCSADSIAAVSTGTQVTQIITSVISGLTLGGTILVAKYAGMKKQEKVEKTIGSTISIFALFSIVLTVLIIWNIAGILQALQIPKSAYDDAYTYIMICCAGIFFICEYNALAAVLRGYGDSLSPLYFVGIACCLNIIGDFYFVGTMHMGVRGSAIATVLSQGVSMIMAFLYLHYKTNVFHVTYANLKIDAQIGKELFQVGIPVSFQECMVHFSFLYLTAITNGLGVYAASAVGIAGKYDVFAMLPATSIANALAAITAQNLAAGKEKRALSFVKYGILISFLCSIVFFLWAQISPQSMLSVFTQDGQVIAAGIPFLKSCSIDYLLVSILFCINGYLNGKEKTVFTMMNCCAGALLIRVPLMFFFAHIQLQDLQLYGLISPISSCVMLVVVGAYLLLNKRNISFFQSRRHLQMNNS